MTWEYANVGTTFCLGKGIPPPHSPPPRRLDLSVPNSVSRKLATLSYQKLTFIFFAGVTGVFTLAIIRSKSYGEGLILKLIFFNKNQKPGQLLCTVRWISVGQVITTCLQLHTGVPPQTRIVPGPLADIVRFTNLLTYLLTYFSNAITTKHCSSSLHVLDYRPHKNDGPAKSRNPRNPRNPIFVSD